MSEQSGGGPITREQVERLQRAALTEGTMQLDEALDEALPDWHARGPEYVREAWRAPGWGPFHAALTRWHDELAAAEPVRRVARWDADLEAYTLTPTHDDGALMTHAVEDAAKARAWGYTIEGGPEPIDDTAPERLRERREALGWTTAYAGHWVPWFDHTDVERAESGKGIPAFVARYAAALSAAEAEPERAASKPHMTPSFRRDIAVMRATGASLSAIADKYLLSLSEVSEAIGPEAQPAPEVVDVPQPTPLPKTVAHFYTIRALPEPHRVSWNMPGDGPQWVRVNDSLWLHVDDLRAMLADIDAQQGGAS